MSLSIRGLTRSKNLVIHSIQKEKPIPVCLLPHVLAQILPHVRALSRVDEFPSLLALRKAKVATEKAQRTDLAPARHLGPAHLEPESSERKTGKNLPSQ